MEPCRFEAAQSPREETGTQERTARVEMYKMMTGKYTAYRSKHREIWVLTTVLQMPHERR
jgi:hypothetical protein